MVQGVLWPLSLCLCLLASTDVQAFTTRGIGRPRLAAASTLEDVEETAVAGGRGRFSISINKVDERKSIPRLMHSLELDQSGRLRIEDGPIILDGLHSTSCQWKAIEPTKRSNCDVCESLFLQVTHENEDSQHELSLGNLISCHKLLACARLTRYWMGPVFGTSANDIPFDTQFLLVQVTPEGPCALILPLVDAGFRATLQSSKGSNLEVICYSESGDSSSTSNGMLALYVAVGDDPFLLLEQGFKQVAAQTGSFKTLDEKEVPTCVDDFGWCTWDAFYSSVTPEGIVRGVESLRAAGVPPRTLILDDGWQTVTPSPSSCNDSALAQSPGRGGFLNFMGDKLAQLATDYYVRKVETAPHGNVHNVIWSYLSKTVLRQGLWNYFDSQTDFARQLAGFEPNLKFQKDAESRDKMKTLGDLVATLKGDLGLRTVFCWHAMHGYWRGISKDLANEIGIGVTEVFPKASRHLLQLDPTIGFDPPALFGINMAEKKSDIETLYRHLHKPLVEAGIDGVKVDVQSGVSAAGSGVGGGPHLARIYTEAMEDSVRSNFGANCINCMCHSTENIYRYSTTAVARASEDFFPGKEESHTVHLINVAYNSLFLSNICLPDWDMFQSKHASAVLHASARAIGGCPVYVSDKPGEHDVQLLKKLVTPDGAILRASLPGRPTRDCLFSDVGKDGETALKIWNHNSGGNIGVCGAFHVQGVAWNFDIRKNEIVESRPPAITARVLPSDVEMFRGMEGLFAVWTHNEGSLHLMENGNAPVQTVLEHQECEIFTISPVRSNDLVSWAPMGLSNMFNSGGSVLEAGDLEQPKLGFHGKEGFGMLTASELVVRGQGQFIAYSNPCPAHIIIEGGTVEFNYDIESGLVIFDIPEATNRETSKVSVLWSAEAAD